MGAPGNHRATAPDGLALPERYRPLRLIASGGTAQVWCAEDRSLVRRVAVKLLAEPYTSDPAAVSRFAREARAAAHLSAHPHVVTIYDIGETHPLDDSPPSPFIVMEHLSGGTVADALRVGEVAAEDAVRWLHEAASALDYAHARGIVHRDIKPANLLLDRHRALHVADFGIAQIGREDSLTIAGQVLGTASYLAPERAIGRPATVASDLYSLAVTAFELLVGRRPFIATSYVAQARQHLEEDPPAPSEINARLPVALNAVMARGMAKAPEQRWASAQTFADAVSDALGQSAVSRTARAAAVSRGRRAGGLAVADRPAAFPVSAAEGPVAPRPVGPGPSSLPGVFAASPSAPPVARRPRSAVPVGTRRPGPAAGRTRSGPGPVAGTNRSGPGPVAGTSRSGYGPAAGSTRSGHRRRVAVLPLAGAVLSLAAVVIGILWIVSSSGHRAAPVRSVTAASAPPKATIHRAASHRHQITQPRPRPRPKPVSRPVTAAVVTPPPPPTADTLQARGHDLLYGGQPVAAIPVLRRAVAAASPTSLTYGYALFDLAHALRLSGDARGAVTLLVARLKIPNQIDKVKAELVLALQAVARQNGALPSDGANPAIGTSPPAGAPAPGQAAGRGRGQKHRGGDQVGPDLAASQD